MVSEPRAGLERIMPYLKVGVGQRGAVAMKVRYHVHVLAEVEDVLQLPLWTGTQPLRCANTLATLPLASASAAVLRCSNRLLLAA